MPKDVVLARAIAAQLTAQELDEIENVKFDYNAYVDLDALPNEPAKETKTADKPVMLGDKILFYLATKAEGRKLAKRAEEVSERIKKIADSPRFKVDSIRTRDLNEPITF